MRRLRAPVSTQTDMVQPPRQALYRDRRWGAPSGWLLLVGGLAITGIFLLALTLMGLAGMVRLMTSMPDAPISEPSPVLLVVPSLASLAPAPDAVTPASSELQMLIASPLPTPTVISSPVGGSAAVESTSAAALPAILVTPQTTSITFRTLFQEVGEAYGIDWRLLAALAFRESRLDPAAVGRDGDMGLMQILPATWDEFAPRAMADEPFDARHNADVAATYLLYLQDTLDSLGHGEIYWVLAAYNWGPNNVRRLVNSGGDWSDVPERQRQYTADILEAAFGVRFVD